MNPALYSLYRTRYFALIARMLCITGLCILSVLTTRAQAPAITLFTPTTVCQGDAVTITGTNFNNVSAVTLGSLPAASFKINDATSITAYVADFATTGPVTVTSPDGTATATGDLTINPSPKPVLIDAVALDPFTNCNGNATYQLKVNNGSTVTGSGNKYDIDWGDGTGHFTQTDWPAGAQASHTYTSQGFFTITLTITPANGCVKTMPYKFYNGQNPLASFTTTTSTTGLCTPAAIQFQVGNWFNNSAGTTYQIDFGDNSPPLNLTHPLNGSSTIQLVSHTYNTTSCPASPDFTAILKASNGCFTTTYTLNQIIIRKKPVADFSVPAASACINDPVCFTNKTINGFSGNTCNTASTLTWDFGDGTAPQTATSPCHTYTTAGTYTVTLSASNTTCGADTKTQTVTIKPPSPPPSVAATPIAYCKGQSASQLAASGAQLLWYTVPTGGAGSPNAPTPATATPGTFTWYVSQTVPGSCESARVPVSVTVNALPAAPLVTTPVQLCENQPAAPLTATGSQLLWYTVATGGTGSSTAPTPVTTAPGATTYYVSQTTNGCEGPRAAIVVNVAALPPAPIAPSPLNYCQNQSVAPLTATGAGLRWYTVAAGGTGSPTAPTPSTAATGTFTYYVSQSTACGESPRTAITVTVTAGPSATIAYATTLLCNVAGSPSVPVTQTGSAGGTYTISPAGLIINPATGELSPAGAQPKTYTITYTVPGSGGCGNFVTTTSVTVAATPSAVISYLPLCTSDAPAAVKLTGTPGGTYASTSGLSIDATTGTITPAASTPGSYTVTYTVAPSPPCPGFSTTATVTITQAPAAAISYSSTLLCNVTNTPATPNPPVPVTQTGTPGGTYSVTPAGLFVDPATGLINPSGATPNNYTIRYSIPGAGGCAAYSVTTSVTVSGTPSASISYPGLCTSDAPTAVKITGTLGGTYSSTPGLSINPATGFITPATTTPGTYTVTYTIAPSSPCPGYTATTTVTVSQAPSAAIAYNPATLCNVANTPLTPNPPVPVIQTGTPGGTYIISPNSGLQLDPLTGMLTPEKAKAGSYIITYTAPGTGACASYSTTATVIVNSAPTATISYQPSYCRAVTTAQPVTRTGTAGGTFSAAAGLALNPATGEINPAGSTPGTYTVTYTIAPSSPCPGYTATATVTIDDSPVLTFAQPVQSICSGGTAIYTPSSTVPGTTYTWSLVGTLPAGVTGSTSGTASGPNATINLSFTNTGAAGRTLTIQVTPVNPAPSPCPGAPYNITLTVNPIPAALAPDTAHFCMGSPAQALTAKAAPGNTIRWYDQNGILLPAAPVIGTTAPGQSRFFATQYSGAGCESPKTLILAIVHPTAKIVGSSYTNPTACGLPSGAIVLNVLDIAGNPIPNLALLVHYNKFATPYTIATTTDATGKITIPVTAGTYSGFYVDIHGCVSQSLPNVFILQDPNPPAPPVAGYNPPICSETPLRLTALSPTSTQAGPISYVWAGPAFGPSPDTTSNAVTIFPSAKTTDAGTYVVYAIQNNCISLPVSFQVAINQSPAKPIITTRNPLCIGDDLILQAASSIPIANATLIYTWKGPGTGFPVNAPNAAISKVTLQDAGIYTITVSAPQTGCSVSTDTLIQIGAYPIVKFARDTFTLPTGYLLPLDPVIVNAAAPGILPMKSYQWTPAQDLTCNNPACSLPVALVKNNTCYAVKATNIYGCSGSDTLCVKVFCQGSQVFIPNAFTPRGDIPENTRLTIRASGIASVKTFRVFNRWGRVVFERDNFAPNNPAYGWDGRVNGKMADPGVYIYTVEVMCENGVPYSYKGNVTLL